MPTLSAPLWAAVAALYNEYATDKGAPTLGPANELLYRLDSGDRLLFEAITHEQKVIDCGILYRTPDASSKRLDDPIAKWLSQCEAALPVRPRTTAQP